MATPDYASNFRDETPLFSNTFTGAPPPYHDPRPGQNPPAGNGVYRSCYFFTDELGGTIVMQLASLNRRFWGAVLDAIFSGLLNLAFWIGASFVIAFLSIATGSVSQRNLTSDTATDTLLPTLLSFLIASTIPFLYHVLLVGLRGQTYGHSICDIRVIRSQSFSVGLVPAMIWALWGIAYGLITSVIYSLMLTLLIPIFYAHTLNSIATASDPTALFIGTLFQVLAAALLTIFIVEGGGALIVLLVLLSNPGRQGMHDKLADTYVVRTAPLTVFGREMV